MSTEPTAPTPEPGTSETQPIQVVSNKESEGATTPAKEETPKAEVATPAVTPPEVTPPAPAVPPVDYKKKFSDSSRRNQVLEAQYRELEKVIGDITKQEVPTDDEMGALDPDWNSRSDFDKLQAKKVIVLERRQNDLFLSMKKGREEAEKLQAIQDAIAAEPRLAGKEVEFEDFATNPKNQGAPLDVLIGAFLYDPEKDTVTPTVPAPADPAPSLERGGASGGMPPPETGKHVYSDEELTLLRTKDPKKYNDLIRRGII